MSDEAKKEGHATCGAKTRSGNPCASAPITGKRRCRMHGGTSTGCPPEKMRGKRNALKHGLFVKSLGPEGQDYLAELDPMAVEVVGEGAAKWMIAKALEATAPRDVDSAEGRLAVILRAAVAAGQLDKDEADRILSRVKGPSMESLGKFLGPVKGLLEVKRGDSVSVESSSGLIVTVAKSDDWQS